MLHGRAQKSIKIRNRVTFPLLLASQSEYDLLVDTIKFCIKVQALLPDLLLNRGGKFTHHNYNEIYVEWLSILLEDFILQTLILLSICLSISLICSVSDSGVVWEITEVTTTSIAINRWLACQITLTKPCNSKQHINFEECPKLYQVSYMYVMKT